MALVAMKGGRMVGRAVAATTGRHKHTLAAEKPQQQQQQKMHQAVSSPVASSPIPMPPNVEELQAAQGCFSPRRTRDVSAKLNQVGGVFSPGFMGSQNAQSNTFNTTTSPVDAHADVYDARITVSLSSVMQTNVPEPFEITGKAPVHLNMPGGHLAQGEKYLSGDLHTYHHSNINSRKKPVE